MFLYLKENTQKGMGKIFSPYLELSNELKHILFIVLFFSLIQIQFVGFSTALMVTTYEVQGALIYAATLFTCSFLGYVGGTIKMSHNKYKGGTLIKEGLLWQGIITSIACLMPIGWWTALLLAIAGAGLGYGWSERQRLEYHHSQDHTRDIYLSLLHSSITILKTIIPIVLVTLVFIAGNQSHTFLLIIGIISVVISLLLPTADALPQVPNIKWKDIFAPSTPHSKEYFLIEGGASILRNCLFIIGIVTAVKSLSAYGLVDSAAAFVSGGVLFWLSHHTQTNGFGRLSRLRIALGLMFIAWAALIISFYNSAVFIIFVVSFAIAAPLLIATKHSLTLKILNHEHIHPAHIALFREVILVFSRILFLLVGALATYYLTPQQAIMYISATLLFLIPIEYYLSSKIHHQQSI